MTTIQDIGICDFCGDEFPMDQLFEVKGKRLPGYPTAYALSDYYCPACKAEHLDKEEPDDTCYTCRGTGEGQYDGARSHSAAGG